MRGGSFATPAQRARLRLSRPFEKLIPRRDAGWTFGLYLRMISGHGKGVQHTSPCA